MSRCHGWPQLLALAAAVALSLAPAARASHEKGGSIDLAIDGAGGLSGHLQYLHTNFAGTCPYTGAPALQGLTVPISGPASFAVSAPLSTITVDCSASTLAESATFIAGAAAVADGAYAATFNSCCRIGGIANTTSTNTVLRAAVVKQGSHAASSPVLTSHVALGVSTHAAYAQNLNAWDPDGGALSFALLQSADPAQSATYDAESPGSNLVSLDATGLMAIPAAITATLPVPAFYVAKVRVGDPDGAYATRDVLLATTDNHPPVLAAATWHVQVVAGHTATLALAASDADGAQLVHFDPAGLPGWAALAATTANPASGTLTLAPPAGTPPQTIMAAIDAVDDDPTVTIRTSHLLQIDVLAEAPAVSVTSRPAALSSDPQPAFGLAPSLAGATMQCSVDGGAWTACADGWRMPVALGDGAHELQARVVLAGGATGAATVVRWTTDTAAPGPPSVVTEAGGRVTFSGEPGATFECAVDGGAWTACASPLDLSGSGRGPHTVSVRQVDAAGNAGAAATSAWTGPEGADGRPPSRVDAVVPAVAAPDAGALAVGCRIDSGTLASCEVRAYVTVTRAGKRKRVLVGRGRTPARRDAAGGGGSQPDAGGAGAGGSSATVRVTLHRRGCRLACRVGGVMLSLDVRAVATDGTVVHSRHAVRVRTPRLIAVPSDGMFRVDGVRLLPRGARAMRRIARRLVGVGRIRCTGHTDSDGPDAYNLRLGLARARATCAFLRRHGVHARMTIASMGERRPRATNRTVRGRARNRRVDISVRCDPPKRAAKRT